MAAIRPVKSNIPFSRQKPPVTRVEMPLVGMAASRPMRRLW